MKINFIKFNIKYLLFVAGYMKIISQNFKELSKDY